MLLAAEYIEESYLVSALPRKCRDDRLRFLLLQLLEQALDQIPVHLKYLDPAADILNANLHLLRPCATVSQLQMTNVLQAHSLLTWNAMVPSWVAH